MDYNNENRAGFESGKPEDHKLNEQATARDIWHAKNRSQGAAAQQTVNQGGPQYYGRPPENGKGRMKNKKPFMIFGGILAGIIVLAVVFGLAGTGSGTEYVGDLSGASGIREDHIGVLYVEGEIGSSGGTYNHEYALDAVGGMMDNSRNCGLMLFVNTPGGGVYESDELYLKIKEYQETTGRPVYAYFASQATSGGYYISACADKIAANRNCWTGSIGVTLGTLYDISGLLEKYGIKTETITSGANKAMGSMTSPMTAEQKQIFQSLVDEAYDQFVSIVADGRGLDKEYVKKIADGRIYTAAQALDIRLIDDIVNTYDDAIDDMMDEYSLYDCEVYEFRYEPETGLLDGLIESIDRAAASLAGNSDISALAEMMEDNEEIPIQYMCKEIK